MDYRDWLDQNRKDLPDEIARTDKETDDQYQAFMDYLTLGRGRSVRRAYYNYSIARGNLEADIPFTPELKISRTFRQWSSDNDWVQRANALDEWIAAKRVHELVNRQTQVEEDAWNDYQMLRAAVIEQVADSEGNLSPRELKEIGLALKTAIDIGRKTAGLPSTITQSSIAKQQDVNGKQRDISADELHSIHTKAEDELDDWESERRAKREANRRADPNRVE